MPEIRLTKRRIEELPLPARGQLIYRDTDLPGFAIRLGARARAYIVETQVGRRTVRLTIGRFPHMSPEEARRLAMERLAEMARGIDPIRERKVQRAASLTVGQAFAAFFETKPNLSLNSRETYERTVRLYLADWARLPLREITKPMVLSRHRKLASQNGEATANSVFRHLRSVYNFTSSLYEDLPPNPVGVLSKARAWAPERRRRTLIAAHQLPAWWGAVSKEHRDARDFLLVALFTGMRRGEVATLRWEDLDLVGRTLHVPRTKNGDPLTLPLSEFLVDLFRSRHDVAGQTEWVFPGPGRTGHIVETKSFTHRVSSASGVAFSLHDLRRTFITIAESLDIPAYALKRLLNHRAASDVTGGYIIINPERLRQPMERIAQRILELSSASVR